MTKKISHRKFMRAMKKRAKYDLIISRYNLQEGKKLAKKAKEGNLFTLSNYIPH